MLIFAWIYPHNPGCNHGKCEGFLAILIPDPKNVICHPGSDSDSASLVDGADPSYMFQGCQIWPLSQAAKPWSCQSLECRYHLWFCFRKYYMGQICNLVFHLMWLASLLWSPVYWFWKKTCWNKSPPKPKPSGEKILAQFVLTNNKNSYRIEKKSSEVQLPPFPSWKRNIQHQIPFKMEHEMKPNKKNGHILE